MRYPSPISLFAAFAILGATFLPASTADVVFPAGSRIGLAAPKGFTPSTVFRGFQDSDNKALIVLFEVPPGAFAEIEKADSIEAVRKQGLTVEKREDFAISGGQGLLFTGTEDAPGIKARKWLLFAKLQDLAVAVNVLVPEAAKDVYPEDAVRAALTTVAIRATPVEEELALLPFRVEDLGGFQILKVAENRSLLLGEDPKKAGEFASDSHMIIGAAPTPQVPERERANFSRDLLANMSTFKDMRVTFAEPIRLGGQQGFEMRVEAKNALSGAEFSIVQWVRFGSGGIIQMVGVAPKEKWAEAFPRFRKVRDSVGAR